MFAKLLVANRGEIARRVIRTCRELGISTVAVFAEPDADAPHVGEADEAVRLPGAAPADTYLRGDLLIAAARRTGAQAVHPGYGFLSENAAFARGCARAGLVFVGPAPAAIEAMGAKHTAKELAAAAGVPVLANVAPQHADDASYPLLVKASYGGGGRGMRVVRAPGELAEAVASAQREAAAAFGDGMVFCERYVESPRHVEVQIFGDNHGHVVALHERECSIQRRHQKVIEECPSPAVDPALRTAISAAAVAVASAIGYVGAGTVEFLLAPDGEFFFLEMNTRLQVEHAVTECVTGLDLVALQLRVAAGEPLPAEAMTARLLGHAIEARLYAEDVEQGYLPQSGRLATFDVGGPGIRVDAGVTSGSLVGVHYDALLAKVIAYAPTRAAAAATLARALARARLHGVTTNRDLLVRVLHHPDFVAGRTDTGFLGRHPATELGRPRLDNAGQRVHALAAALAAQASRRASARVLGGLPSGWRNNASQPQLATYTERDNPVEIRYRFTRDGLCVDGWDDVVLHAVSGELVDLTVDGVRRRYCVLDVDGVTYVDSPLGSSALAEVPRFPDPSAALAAGSLTAPMPGSVARVVVRVGQPVAPGDLLVVLEAMKMEHRVEAPAAGTVTEVLVEVGNQVDAGAALVVIGAAAG